MAKHLNPQNQPVFIYVHSKPANIINQLHYQHTALASVVKVGREVGFFSGQKKKKKGLLPTFCHTAVVKPNVL